MPSDTKKGLSDLDILISHPGRDWHAWLSGASRELPELERALQALASLSSQVQAIEPVQTRESATGRDLIKVLYKYIGASKCPSNSACEKMAFRVRVVHGWLDAALQKEPLSHFQKFSFLSCGLAILDRLFATCEGADDKKHVLTLAVRDFTRMWLKAVQEDELLSDAESTTLLYQAALTDSIGVVTPQWWWTALKAADRPTLLFLVQQSIDAMPALQPSLSAGWKSYEGRWHRLRVRALLEAIEDLSLLAELKCKSAVDDFEAAEAIRCLRIAGKNRQAISQGEQWLKNLAGSPVLAEALLEVYIEDGWDEEGIKLLASQYELDPNPKWLELLRQHFGRTEFKV